MEPRPAAIERSLKIAHVRIERKVFVLALKENPRGRFLRITEDFRDKHESIIIPSTGLGEFTRAVAEMAQLAGELPPPPPTATTNPPAA